MKGTIQKLTALGQSIWYDNIQRRLLENGELAGMIDRGEIRGITSNPSIFHNAIAKTNDYDAALIPLAWSGWNAEQIFWQLAIEDIRQACDLFSPLYQQCSGLDGYVSLEVNPTLAHNTEETLTQAKQLWEWVDRPNLMVKIPATLEGLPAIQAAISAGINVNVTLIFSIERYRLVMDAYLAGLDSRLAAGLAISHIASVASFFVSRMDSKVDALLPEGSKLRGKAAIAYTKLAYQEYKKVFEGGRFTKYETAGGTRQRPLWASTSTKNAAYPDTLYLDNLVGAGTVNTVPPQTLDAFRDHGRAALTITNGLAEADQTIADLASQGILMDTVTAELEVEGVKTFAEAFTALLKTIDERRSAALTELGALADPVRRRIASLIEKDYPGRLWAHDPTLWTNSQAGREEVLKRLGWLELPDGSRSTLEEIKKFSTLVHKDGFTHVLLLGMGGSSLAPEVFQLMFPVSEVHFAILDSTDPAQIHWMEESFPPGKTLVLVSSKSGDTLEVQTLFNYFWERSGRDGSHFAAITDPGTSLDALANARGFRETFLALPTVGGRYSALGHFGLVPAALMGIDPDLLLDRAARMVRQCRPDVSGARNPGLVLGAVLGQAALDGRDKLTFIADDSVAPFGAWLEQLITESSGKLEKGIIVVNGEEPADPAGYGEDRLFVYLRREGRYDDFKKALIEHSNPVLVFNIADPYDLGAEVYRWEVATAFACSIMGINAFDQPDVQDAKNRTKARIDAYSKNHSLGEDTPLLVSGGVRIYSNMPLKSTGLSDDLKEFLIGAGEREYIAINAYLPRIPKMEAELNKLRSAVRRRVNCPVTLGFGPRYLHSTGQLHKGGPGTGLFLLITTDPQEDINIPGKEFSFGVLEQAQALGDYEALASRGRRILRIHLPSPDAINGLIEFLNK